MEPAVRRRAFEGVYYTFDLRYNFGMFRDLHRHRVLTLQRHLLTVDRWFEMPDEIETLGIKKEYADCMQSTRDAFEKTSTRYLEQAQYVANYPCIVRFNLREARCLVELRTVPRGMPTMEGLHKGRTRRQAGYVQTCVKSQDGRHEDVRPGKIRV